MEKGYVLIHVLEAVVPGRDLGEVPGCEVSLGTAAESPRAPPVSYPVPSTLQSENITLPTHGEDEAIVVVRALDSNRDGVGSVVVPVNTLVPLEVWNVWYAMDEGDDTEDVSPEDTPKMHLLLQYVPRQTACEETQQSRDMREQDFLLRALQQLNASLEAKVMGHQGGMAASASTSMAEIPSSASLGLAAARPPTPPPPLPVPGSGAVGQLRAPPWGGLLGAAAAAPPPTPPAAAAAAAAEWTPVAAEHGAAAASAAALGQPRGLMATPPMAGFGQAGSTSQPSTQPPSPALTSQSRRGAGASAGASASTTAAAAVRPAPTAKQLADRERWEDMLRSRLEPYERAIAAFEERQRAYDDQQSRVRDLTRSLEDREERARALHAQLETADGRWRAAVGEEQQATKQAQAACTALEQQVVELQQEIALRRAHEDSLEKRVAHKESELSVMHEKYVLANAVEEELRVARLELAAEKEGRGDHAHKLQGRQQEVARLEEEALKQREEHAKALLQAKAESAGERSAAGELRLELQKSHDLSRDKAAEHALLVEKAEELVRQLATTENEVSSYRTLLDRERFHRRELEKKFEEQELKRLNSIVDDHRQIVKELRQETEELRQSLEVEQQRSAGLETELAGGQREAAGARTREAETRQLLTAQEDLHVQLREGAARQEQLQASLKASQDDVRKMTERRERELADHSQASKVLCEDRDGRQRELGELRREVQRLQQRSSEQQRQLEQTSRALEQARESCERHHEVHQQLKMTQEEARGHHSGREELHAELRRITTKFQEDGFSRERRCSDLESALEERNNEIKLLMYRVQELSSKYVPVRSDHVDVVLAKWVNGYRPAVPFFRLAAGTYLFGRRQVTCKVANDKPVFRVGGGFIGFDKFLELYASEELERLLNYEVDDRTGEPKFCESLRMRHCMEESGAVDHFRHLAAETQAARGEGLRSQGEREVQRLGSGTIRGVSPGHGNGRRSMN